MARGIRSVKPVTGVKGLDIVTSNLNRAIKDIGADAIRGLIESSILLRNEMEHTPPLTPVDTGNLRSSWFVVAATKGVVKGKSPRFKGKKSDVMAKNHATAIEEARAKVSQGSKNVPLVVMGYSANYAYYVHEMLGATFQRHGAGPQWFMIAMQSNKKQIIETVRKYSTVK